MVVVFGLISCEDFLVEEPKGEPTNANFWKTEADVISATTALYIFNDFQGIYGRGMNLYSLVPSDDFVVGKPKSQIEEIKDFITSGNGSYTIQVKNNISGNIKNYCVNFSARYGLDFNDTYCDDDDPFGW